MSIVAEKRSYADALAAAENCRELFPPRCWCRWEFAGSLRRKKSEVGDIEHVIIPSFQVCLDTSGLFQQKVLINELWFKLDYFVSIGYVSQHVHASGAGCWGEKHRMVKFEGNVHDIYLA